VSERTKAAGKSEQVRPAVAPGALTAQAAPAARGPAPAKPGRFSFCRSHRPDSGLGAESGWATW
jgi:hypothetical protein